jgi:hypothetical protein
MKGVAIEREAPAVEDGEFKRHLPKAEALAVWRLMQDDVVREVYFRADAHAAVLVLECADADAARAALGGLPVVQAGLITFEVIPLAAYPGFARLFATEQ